MMFCKLPALFGAIAFYLALVHAHPIWNIFNTRNSIDSLVTGSSPLVAGIKFGETHYLTTPRPPGSTGALTVSLLSSQDDAPLFFVHNDKLFHYTNDSYIFHVNVLNITGNTSDEPLPYQLVLSETHDGLLYAMWRWRGAFLHLDHGQKTTNGLYYVCLSGDGKEGVYASFDLLISPPKGCKVFTLHSVGVGNSRAKQRPLSA